jgi:S-DNA-T family DNA segregation ATPase FtsK/SpoIIIE
VNRRTRRARRRLRRGDARREPLLLLTDEPYPGDYLAALGRIIYRYRSELAPAIIATALAVAGGILHSHVPHGWPLVAVTGTAIAVGFIRPEIAPDLRRIERVYAVVVTTVTGLWLTLATAFGPTAGPLLWALLMGTVIGGVPWWAHRRRRAKVRVERTLDAWPDIAEAVGLPGSRIMSAVVDLWGWRARIRLHRGQTVGDLINRTDALESGLGTRPGALRIEPDADHADRAVIRVLNEDPHARAIAYSDRSGDSAQEAGKPASIAQPVPLGLFEDARPVTVALAHRHGLLGGVAGAGKSGVLNVILAYLTACPDVVLWGIDLKGGMELAPWASCLDRLATTPEDATNLLGEAVAILDARARHLTSAGARLWNPSPSMPALMIVIDEYAELTEQSPVAVAHADSIARRGRAPAVTLLTATQRPTQKAMGSGAVRSQMDVRLCLRVRERRDVDLILGQGMLAAGWHAHTLDAPGKFLISTPEQHVSRRARAYLLTDDDVRTLAQRNSARRNSLDPLSQDAADEQRSALLPPSPSSVPITMPATASDDPNVILADALHRAPDTGMSVPDLMAITGMGRTWIYDRLQELAAQGRATQVARGRWLARPQLDADDSPTDRPT